MAHEITPLLDFRHEQDCTRRSSQLAPNIFTLNHVPVMLNIMKFVSVHMEFFQPKPVVIYSIENLRFILAKK